MRKIPLATKLAAGAAGLGLIAVLSACGSPWTQRHDLEGVQQKDPDKAELYTNVDEHPNVVRICIDGVAFATTTRNYGDAIMRVPEWDTWCVS